MEDNINYRNILRTRAWSLQKWDLQWELFLSFWKCFLWLFFWNLKSFSHLVQTPDCIKVYHKKCMDIILILPKQWWGISWKKVLKMDDGECGCVPCDKCNCGLKFRSILAIHSTSPHGRSSLLTGTLCHWVKRYFF